ncbi:unnamed protein product [Rhizoctonia solani]|uniref:Uncharacterized protein n=1 Tax=Rhizoctonia solani TaxID=456999 RepID=A0A8H3BCH1_9AGAM|nr:unnamed protein product [Rhizoctonia solani]
MSRQPAHSMNDEQNWPKLGAPSSKTVARQPVCELDQSPFTKSLSGVAVNPVSTHAPGRQATQPIRPSYPRLTIKSDEARSISFSEVVRRGSPPPSPISLQPALPPLETPAKKVKPSTHGSFPPLSASQPSTKDAPARKNSYAAATATGACVPPSALSPNSTAKVISLNIGSVSVPDVRPPTPTQSTPRMKRRGTSAPSNTLSPPQFEGRNRSASVSSVATSIATNSSRGPASSKTSVCQTPVGDDTEWQSKLVALAQTMTGRDRAAWEKILRCDPKDTSKLKWNTFEKALRALKFKPQARGGSETEYTPDPEYFGPKAQPISYHRRKFKF